MLNIDGKQLSVFLGVGGLLRGQELGESLCLQLRTRPVWEPEKLRLTWPVSPVRQARAVVLRCSTELPGVWVSNRVPNTAAQLVCTGQNWVFSGGGGEWMSHSQVPLISHVCFSLVGATQGG